MIDDGSRVGGRPPEGKKEALTAAAEAVVWLVSVLLWCLIRCERSSRSRQTRGQKEAQTRDGWMEWGAMRGPGA